MAPEISIDWLTFTASPEQTGYLRTLLERTFGRGFTESGAMGLYSSSLKHDLGFRLLLGQKQTGRSMVSLPGSILKEVDPNVIVRFVASVADFGIRCTRCDVALDFHGADRPSLVGQVVRACKSGALCGLRRVEFYHADRDGVPINRGVGLGKRGSDGSGRYVRVYDKGLQTGEAPHQHWERWETEFSGDVAQQVVEVIRVAVESTPKGQTPNPWPVLMGATLGAVDFRTPGAAHIARRKRQAWFQTITQGIATVRLRRAPVVRRLDATIAWLRGSVSRVCRGIMDGAGLALADILDPLEVECSLPMYRLARGHAEIDRIGHAPEIPDFVPC